MHHVRIKPQLDSDIIIVGGGPAGASAAHYLSTAGLKVILIDSHCFPRDKVCGDFISPIAIKELQRLGVTHLPEYRETNIIRSAALHIDGEEMISRSIPHIKGSPPFGRVIPRMLFDHLILGRAYDAGTTVLEGFRAQGFQLESDHIAVVAKTPKGAIELKARLLVGADGSNSLIARQLHGQGVSKVNRIVAVRAYFEEIEGPSDQADLYFSETSFPGYYWLFPTGRKSANVGVGMLVDTYPPSSDNLRNLMENLIRSDCALARRLRNARLVGKVTGWPLSTYNASMPLVDERVILVGDAAGLINPLNGEGIQYALLSGRLAAETVIEALAHDQFSTQMLQQYAYAIENTLRYDMALPKLIIQFIRNRSLNPLWMRVLKTIVNRARLDPEYARTTGGILVGSIPSEEALSLRIVGNTVEQAFLSFGFETLVNIPQGTKYFAQIGFDIGRVGLGLIYDVLQSPHEFLRWGTDVADSAVELANQAVREGFIQRRFGK